MTEPAYPLKINTGKFSVFSDQNHAPQHILYKAFVHFPKSFVAQTGNGEQTKSGGFRNKAYCLCWSRLPLGVISGI